MPITRILVTLIVFALVRPASTQSTGGAGAGQERPASPAGDSAAPRERFVPFDPTSPLIELETPGVPHYGGNVRWGDYFYVDRPFGGPRFPVSARVPSVGEAVSEEPGGSLADELPGHMIDPGGPIPRDEQYRDDSAPSGEDRAVPEPEGGVEPPPGGALADELSDAADPEGFNLDLELEATQRVKEGLQWTTRPVTDLRLRAEYHFPDPELPGEGQPRDESTGADQPPYDFVVENGKVRLRIGRGTWPAPPELEKWFRDQQHSQPPPAVSPPTGWLFQPFLPQDSPPAASSGATAPAPQERPVWVGRVEIDLTPRGALIVRLADEAPALSSISDYFATNLGVTVEPFSIGASDFVRLDFPSSELNLVDELLDQTAWVDFSEMDVARQIQVAPDDPYLSTRSSWDQPYDDQWAIKRVGFTPEPASAWSLVPNGQPVVVAVIDTGLDWNHEDIAWDNIWTNPGEVRGNGVDDDGNGYVDDVIGWDFWRRSPKPWDRNGHGTLVAGVIAARSGNGTGIAGIVPRARIMVLKGLNGFGRTRASFLAEAIAYAADNGARVVNVSVGGKQRTRTEQIAIEHAHAAGAVVVVSSGNEGVPLEQFGPGGVPQVISVAATDIDDAHAAYSNWGPGVDVAAPGDDVLGPRARYTDLMQGLLGGEYTPGDAFVGEDRRYYRASGTSFAAPIVSGIASLLLSREPGLTNDEVKRTLLHSARDVEVPGRDQYTGYGLVDAIAALRASPDFYLESAIAGIEVILIHGRHHVRVTGTADADRFERAWIEVGAGTEPKEWRRVSSLERPVRDGVLSDVEAEHFRASPEWTLRLVTEHGNGRRREARFLLSLG